MMYSAIEVQAVLEELSLAAQDVTRMAAEMAKTQGDLAMFKADELATAKRNSELVVNGATMEAYAAGAVNGKNQAERDMQLIAYLAQHTGAMAAQAELNEAERVAAQLDADLTERQMAYKAATYRLVAARAKSELMRAMIDAGAQPEVEGELQEYGF